MEFIKRLTGSFGSFWLRYISKQHYAWTSRQKDTTLVRVNELTSKYGHRIMQPLSCRTTFANETMPRLTWELIDRACTLRRPNGHIRLLTVNQSSLILFLSLPQNNKAICNVCSESCPKTNVYDSKSTKATNRYLCWSERHCQRCELSIALRPCAAHQKPN